jgi:hypothetical protein
MFNKYQGPRMKQNVIYLLKGSRPHSSKQFDEINKIFKRYDIKIIANVVATTQPEIQTLLKSSNNNEKILAALLIQSNLKLERTHFKRYQEDGDIETSPETQGLLPAEDECIVHSYKFEEGKLIHKCFNYSTSGYVPGTLGFEAFCSELFDHQFILKNTCLTYSELERHNMKNTSRCLAVSKFICDEIYYPSPINLNFNPQKQNGTIDFQNDPADLLKNNVYFNNPLARQYGLTNMFHTVLNRGVFFRSAKNRREKNYWCPALNAGLPLTPKKDLIHEITFMAHDFGHFLIPDLLYTGTHNAKNQQIYITYRMMSEAFTLVLADMIFVDSLEKSGFEYDYSKRKIYPLFKEFEIDLTQSELYLTHVKKMLRASVDYCLMGDDSGLDQLSIKYRNKSQNLQFFKEKYMKFFCEDFKWTKQNYNCFKNSSDELKRWWELVKPLRDKAKLDTETIEEFSKKINLQTDCLIDSIFNELFHRVSEVLQKEPVTIVAFSQRQLKAFFRYMMGQLLILVRYELIVKEAKVFQRIIIQYLTEIKNEIRMENIDYCRAILSDFVDILLDKNLINYDDAQTYKEIFPVFEPSFAYYDEKIDFYKDLSTVAYESIYAL